MHSSTPSSPNMSIDAPDIPHSLQTSVDATNTLQPDSSLKLNNSGLVYQVATLAPTPTEQFHDVSVQSAGITRTSDDEVRPRLQPPDKKLEDSASKKPSVNLPDDDYAFLENMPVVKTWPLACTKIKQWQFDEVKELIADKQYTIARINCEIILRALKASSEQYVSVVHAFKRLEIITRLKEGELEAVLDIPITSRKKFIGLHLTIQRLVRSGQLEVLKPMQLELYCCRHAAHAGSSKARVILIKKILFCLDGTPYMPFEAERELARLAFSDENLPLNQHCPFEAAIKRLIEQINLPNKGFVNEDEAECDKQNALALALVFSRSSEPMIKALVPMIYLSTEFGVNSSRFAADFLSSNKVAEPTNELREVSISVMQYWQSRCLISTGKEPKGIAQLKVMASSGFLAATFFISELYRWSADMPKCNEFFVQATSSHLATALLSPDACYSLFQCFNKSHQVCSSIVKSSKPRHSTHQAVLRRVQERSEHHSITAKILLQKAKLYGHEAALFFAIESSCRTLTLPQNTKLIGKEGLIGLTCSLVTILHEHKFSLLPTLLILTHIKQCFEQKETDEQLIELAMEQNRIDTSMRLLFLHYFTKEYDSQRLTIEVLATNLKVSDFNNYIEFEFCEFMEHLTSRGVFFRAENAEELFFLFCQVRQINENHLGIKNEPLIGGIHPEDLSKYIFFLAITGYWEDAVKYSIIPVAANSRAHPLTGLSDKSEMGRYVDKHVMRSSLLSQHHQLRAICIGNYLPGNTRLNLKKINLLYSDLKDCRDPELLDAFAFKCRDFALWSMDHITLDDFNKLYEVYLEIRQKVLLRSNELIQLARRSIKCKAELCHDINSHHELDELNQALKAIDEAIKTSSVPISTEFKEASMASTSASSSLSVSQDTDVQRSSLRLPVSTDRYHLFVEHYVERFIRENPEIDFDVHLNILEKTINKDSHYCPVSLFKLLPEDLKSLSVKHKRQSIRVLVHLSNKLCTKQKECEVSYKEILKEHLKLLRTFIETHPESRENKEPRYEREKSMLKLTIEQPEFLLGDGKYMILDAEVSLYCKFSNSFESPFEQLNALLASLPNASIVVDWAQRIKPTLTKEAKKELIEKCASLDPKEFMRKLVIYHLVDDKNTALWLSSLALNTKRAMEHYTQVIWFSLSVGIIDKRHAQKLNQRLTKNSIFNHFLSFHISENTEEAEILAQALLRTSHLGEFEFDHWNIKQLLPSVGMKLIAIHKPDLAHQCFTAAKQFNEITLLHWKHGMGDIDEDLDVALLKLAENGDASAQCRLIDWQLEHNKLSDIALVRCTRYILTQDFIYSSEKELYKGIVYLIGMGVSEDLTKAKQYIGDVLKSDNPIPCLRLIVLKKMKRLDTRITPQDLPELFAKKWYYSKDIDAEICLSCSIEELKCVLVELSSYKKNPTNTLYIDSAKHKLESLIGHVQRWCFEQQEHMSFELALSQAQKKAASTGAEEKCISEEGLLIIEIGKHSENKLDSKKVVSLLHSLEKLQKEQFPKFSQSWLPNLFLSIPMRSANKNLMLKLLNAIEDKKGQVKLLMEDSTHLFTSPDISAARGDFVKLVEARNVFVNLLPEEYRLQQKHIKIVISLLNSYAIQNTQLPQKLVNILKDSAPEYLVEVLVIQQPRFHMFVDLSLYCYEERQVGGSQLLLKILRAADTTSEQKISAIRLLGQTSSSECCYWFSTSLVVSNKEKFQIFLQLTLPTRVNLLSDKAHGSNVGVLFSDVIWQQIEAQAKAKSSPDQGAARGILSSHVKSDLKKLSLSYLVLEDPSLFNLRIAIGNRMKRVAEDLLQQPVSQWNGDISRFLALAVKGLFVNNQ